MWHNEALQEAEKVTALTVKLYNPEGKELKV